MQLFKRSSRTVTGYSMKHTKRNLNKNLLFCIHRGKNIKSKSSGVRPIKGKGRHPYSNCHGRRQYDVNMKTPSPRMNSTAL